MLKPKRDYTLEKDAFSISVSLNELPGGLIADLRDNLGVAASHITILDSLNQLFITVNTNYSIDDVFDFVDDLLSEYYTPIPEAFSVAWDDEG
jgi:hypothetical protein